MRKRIFFIAFILFYFLIATETIFRLWHHYSLNSFTLVSTSHSPNASQENFNLSAPYIFALTSAADANLHWYRESPKETSRRFNTTRELKQRWHPNPGIVSDFAYNFNLVRKAVCTHATDYNSNLITSILQKLQSIYVYYPKSAALNPPFRLLPNKVYPGENREPGGYVTNSFGFLSPEISIKKPAQTIRIAFVGSSTTADEGSYPHRFSDLIEHWLNLWAEQQRLSLRFETINAARGGLTSTDIAAIVRDEILPLQPDLILYYEGANQFWPFQFLQIPSDFKIGQEIQPLHHYTKHSIIKYSALAEWVENLFIYHDCKGGFELDKPYFSSTWPAAFNATQLNLANPNLPLNLSIILNDWNHIRDAAHEIQAEFIPLSFIWYSHANMTLTIPQNYALWQSLNRGFWPANYAWIEQMAAFQNRVFRQYAQDQHLNFIDIASVYPKNPDFFVDAVHMTYEGSRLRAWIIYNKLLPLLQRKIANKELPKTLRKIPFTPMQTTSSLLTLKQITAMCK